MTDETTVFPSEVEAATTDNVEFIEPSQSIGDNTTNPNANKPGYGAEGQPNPPAASTADQVIPGFKVVVWFDFVKGEFRDKQRVVLNGVVDIRTERDMTNVESLIREQLGFDRVFITNWKSLEG